jgi:hypothetical protein
MYRKPPGSHRLVQGLASADAYSCRWYGRVRHPGAGAAQATGLFNRCNIQVKHRHLDDELSVGAQFCHRTGCAGRHITPYRQVVRDTRTNLATLTGRAALLDGDRQAETVAIDNFKLMMFVSFWPFRWYCWCNAPRPPGRQSPVPE